MAKSTRAEHTKIIVNLPDATVENLLALAKRRGLTMTEAIVGAISLADGLSLRTTKGYEVHLHRRGREYVVHHSILYDED